MDINKLNQTEAYKAVLVIVTALVVFSLIFKIQLLLAIAVAIGLASALSAHICMTIAKGWFRIANALGWVNSRIFLSILFFLALTPIAVIFRIRKNDPLQLSKKGSGSLFTKRDHTYIPKDLENPW